MSDAKKKSKGIFRLLSPLRSATSTKPRLIDRPNISIRVADYGSILIHTADEPFTQDELAEQRPSADRTSSSGYSREPSGYRNGGPSRQASGTSTPEVMTSSPPEFAPPANKRPELEISGTIAITMPPHLGQRRVKAIRVGLSAKTKLHMGKQRGWEEDEIFHRKMEMKGEDGDGVVLDPGNQVFTFTLFVPDTIPVHDWFPTAICGLTLYAEIEGLAPPQTAAAHRPSPPSSSRSRSRSATPYGSAPRSGSATPAAASRSGSPSRHASSGRSRLPSRQSSMVAPEAGGLNSLMERLEDMSIATSPVPAVPAYNASASGTTTPRGGAPWWTGTERVGIPFEILYNPNPAGGVTELNLRLMGEQAGLGGYRIDLTSAIWTVSAPIQAKLTIPVPPLTSTIYAMRVLLSQTTNVYSPRDPPDAAPVSTNRVFSIIEAGSIPPRGARGDGLPSLWRGKEAGGEEVDELVLEKGGWLPSDDACRPSSVPQMQSPIRVSHQLITEVFFSVMGEDDFGRPIAKDQQPGLRIFRLTKSIVVPSCAMIPLWLQPPSYDSHASSHPPGPCPHRPLAEDWAQDAREYKPDLDCLLCRQGVPPTTRPGWRDCACGLRGDQLEERGRRLNEMQVGGGANASGARDGGDQVKWVFDTSARGPEEGGREGEGGGEREEEEEQRGRRGRG